MDSTSSCIWVLPPYNFIGLLKLLIHNPENTKSGIEVTFNDRFNLTLIIQPTIGQISDYSI